jgi:hypothetical protein
MPWRDATSIPFTHIDIVAHIPSESGVYGIIDGERCIFVGESWNLKARLLGLAAALPEVSHLRIRYEICPDDIRVERKNELVVELIRAYPEQPVTMMALPGISFPMPTEQ